MILLLVNPHPKKYFLMYILVCYFVDFRFNDFNISINLSLVVLINFWYGEQSNVSDYEKRETVKPCPDVRQAPEENAEFDGVEQIFDEDPSTEFVNGRVDVDNSYVRYFSDFIRI